MQTNRLLSRSDAGALDLQARVELEARVTDTIGSQIKLPTIPDDWKFTDYTHRRPWRKHLFDFLGSFEGKTVLDLGCGFNPTPVYFALAGAKKVIACDVSTTAVEYVANLAREFEVEDRVVTHCGPAESLPFDDDSIDLVHGEAVLHHLDLDVAGAELARIMKQGGRAAFKDPLGHNLLLEFARDYFPYRWKHSVKGTDCPLKFPKIREFGQHFSHCEARGFGCFSMLAVAIQGRRDSGLQSVGHWIDAGALRAIPWLQRSCRFVVTCVEV
jgi:SAM-dependent methyltransferase